MACSTSSPTEHRDKWCGYHQSEFPSAQSYAHHIWLLVGRRSPAKSPTKRNPELSNLLRVFRKLEPNYRPPSQISAARRLSRIVYLAYRSHGNTTDQLSIDRQATDLGMSYVHIPVPWQAPFPCGLPNFCAVMNSQPGQKTLLHCKMNYRASAFSFLYRVLELDTSLDDAAKDLFAVWTPDQTWLEFINNVLAANNRAALLPPTDL